MLLKRNGVLQNNILFLRQEFCKCQHAVKAAVDSAREGRILKVANQEEFAMNKGRAQWECMKKLQAIYHGCKPGQVIRKVIL